MPEKLKSRKLLVTFAIAALNIFAPALSIPAEAVLIITKFAGLYVGGESIIDAARASK